MSSDVIRFLQSRRSVVAKKMVSTAPTDEQLQDILRCGLRVPDHSNVQPWRIVVFQGEARQKFSHEVVLPAAIANARAKNEELSDAMQELEVNRMQRGGVVIAVLSTPVIPHKIPVWEQHLTAGAVCSHILIAAQSLDCAAQWITEWLAYDAAVIRALGGDPQHDQVAGFIHIGAKAETPNERARPDEAEKVSYWT
jgi:nitroreductase